MPLAFPHEAFRNVPASSMRALPHYVRELEFTTTAHEPFILSTSAGYHSVAGQRGGCARVRRNGMTMRNHAIAVLIAYVGVVWCANRYGGLCDYVPIILGILGFSVVVALVIVDASERGNSRRNWSLRFGGAAAVSIATLTAGGISRSLKDSLEGRRRDRRGSDRRSRGQGGLLVPGHQPVHDATGSPTLQGDVHVCRRGRPLRAVRLFQDADSQGRAAGEGPVPAGAPGRRTIAETRRISVGNRLPGSFPENDSARGCVPAICPTYAAGGRHMRATR